MRFATEKSVAAGLASAPFTGASARRVGLWISVPPGVQLTISQLNPAVAGQGLVIKNSVGPVYLCSDHIGDWIQRLLFCISDTAGVTIGVIEVFKEETQPIPDITDYGSGPTSGQSPGAGFTR